MYKIDKLLKLERKLFHTQDLALLWNISNKNTLYTTIKRYLQKGILIAIHKGFYSTIPSEQLEPNILGVSFLHTYCYLSTETVFATHGIMSQIPQSITFISTFSKAFKIGNLSYLSRQMKSDFLFSSLGINEINGVFTATLSRAVSDMLYLNPKYHFDNPKLVNWDQVAKLQKEIGFI